MRRYDFARRIAAEVLSPSDMILERIPVASSDWMRTKGRETVLLLCPSQQNPKQTQTTSFRRTDFSSTHNATAGVTHDGNLKILVTAYPIPIDRNV